MKTTITFVLAIVFQLLLITSISNSQTTVSIRLGPTTGEDCLVLTNFPGVSFPEHPDLAGLAGTVQSNYFAGRSYFKFDLSSIPTNSVVSNAKLSLFANPNPSNNRHEGINKSYLRRLMSPWTANTTSHDLQPDFTYAGQIELPTSSSPTQDYLDIDVTNFVSMMISDPVHNYGFQLALWIESPYASMNFASSDCPDVLKRPLLVVTYESPLPVELTSFTSLTNGRNVSLNWTTSKEENNSGFEVYRAIGNSKSEFVKIGFVKGKGNSNSNISYTFEDKNLTTGSYAYSIKQIDFNGNSKTYNLANDVSIGVPQNASLFQNYPNPFNPTTTILYDVPEEAAVKILLYDQSGREVKTLINELKSAGYFTLNLDASDLSSGAYFYKLIVDPVGSNATTYIDSKKMILIK